MKGLILSGGKGTRLRPFTYSGAKQLVPIANTPVLHFPVRQLVEAGITEIGIIVGETGGQIRDAMGEGEAFGARFTYIPQVEPLGLAHAVAIAEGFLGGEPFIMYLGDNVLLGGIEWFVDAFRREGTPAVIVRSVPDPSAFGVAEVADGHLVRMVEKPKEPPTDLAVIGVYAFVPAVFGVIARQKPSARGELEIADAINGLAAAGIPVRAARTEAAWIDTGKMEDILAANRAILRTIEPGVDPSARLTNVDVQGQVRIGPGAILRDARVLGPAVIGAGTVVEGSTVGPDVALGDRAVVRYSTVVNAIVMEDTVVDSCDALVDSMVGRDARLTRMPAASRVALGDHSRVEVG
ncbi:MAG: glucose-1-phosphate thymidylyltransferase [Dehalococcoidia bacterium]